MNGIDVFRLGRRLMKVGLDAIPASPLHTLPSSVRMVMIDVFENPDSSISEITARTGFPQSHVSSAVAELRDRGVFVTTVDEKDRRRTLVRRSPESAAAAERLIAPIEPALGRAAGTSDAAVLREIVAALGVVAEHLTPDASTRPLVSTTIGS